MNGVWERTKTWVAYDVRDRIVGKSWNDGTPQIWWSYDQTSWGGHGIGHRTAECTNHDGTVCQHWRQWKYDARGRVIHDGQWESGIGFDIYQSYDSADKLLTVTDVQHNDTQTTSYDAAWRPLSLYSSVLQAMLVSNAQYTAYDAPTNQTLGYGFTRQWTYDPVGRPTRSWLPNVLDRSYAYDAADNLTVLNNDMAGEGQGQTFTYDHRNRLTNANGGPAAGITYNESYTYNTIDSLTNKAGVSYSYPATGQARPSAPTSIGGVAQTYDASGNLTSDGLRTYTWDGANRLKTATTGQAVPLTFGPSQIPHGVGRADSDGWSANTTQDNAGHLTYGPYTTAVSSGAQTASWEFAIDNATADNLVVAIVDVYNYSTNTVLGQRAIRRSEFTSTMTYQTFTVPFSMAPGSGGQQVELRVWWADTAYLRLRNTTVRGATESYRYDPNGIRVQRTANGVTSAYHGAWQEWTNGVGRCTNYVFGGKVVAQRNTTSGVVTMLIGDHLGSVSATTTMSGVRQSVQYFDPWGKIRSGTVQASTFNDTGQRRDDTGLLYDNARYYDPARGQFVSSDSMVADLSNPATLNRYAYAFNNPLRYTDPSGHCNVDGTDGDDPATCQERISQIAEYGVTVLNVEGLWSLLELQDVLAAIVKLATWAAWTPAQFYAKVGRVYLQQTASEYTKDFFNNDRSAVAKPVIGGGTIITIAQTTFTGMVLPDGTPDFQRTVIHELAHAWDFNSGWRNSAGLRNRDRHRIEAGDPTRRTTPYGKASLWEDWAETVAESVLGTDAVDQQRKDYAKSRTQ